VPISVGLYSRDDTPLDSRDSPPIGEPKLVDGDLAGRVPINVGPTGLLYQNLIADMGRVVALDMLRVTIRDSSGNLVPTAGLVRWDVFTSVDGLDWIRMPTGAQTNFVFALSAYDVTFEKTSARFFKVVSFGTNSTDAFVTELQAFFHTQIARGETRRTDQRIVSANLNAILDRAEDPEKMVRLMIQEMEDTLIEVKSNCAGFMAEQKRMERSLEQAQADAGAWEAKARLAVEKGRDDLARAALAEKQRYLHKVDTLKEQVDQIRDLVGTTQAEIAQLEGKLNDAREKQRIIIQRRAAAVTRYQTQAKIRQIDTSEAFAKFEAYENGIERMEAEASLVDSLRPKETSLRERFAELEHEDAIEQELENLKKKVRPND
jgi:phage shock protein A